MFIENLLGQLIRLRQPILSDFDNAKPNQFLALDTNQEAADPQNKVKLYEETREDQNCIVCSVDNLSSNNFLGFVSVNKSGDKFTLDISVNNSNSNGKEIVTESVNLVLNYLSFKKKIKEVYAYCGLENYVLKNILINFGFLFVSKDEEKSLFHVSL